jgi:hypothetical protein
MIRFGIALLAVLLTMAPWASAQGASAQLNGVVKDVSRAVVPGATITATNIDTQVQRRTASGEEGSYAIPLLPPGTYRLTVEKTGFQPQVRSGISLEVDQVATIDAVLQPGDVTQAVEVAADAPLLAVTNPTLGEVINNVQVESLPMNGRQPFRLLELTPGVFKAPSSNGQFQDIPVNQGNETIFSISGGRARTNDVLIDGVPSTVGPGNTITTIPPVDATEEFDVMSGPLKAEWGRTGGGVLNVYTKSGANRVHGGVFDFLRNDAFDANDFFANTVGQKKPKFRINQYGFTLGGPIWLPRLYKGRDKTFFFVDYQGTRWVQGSTFFATVPAPEQRQGNFTHTFTSSGALITMYDPFSTVHNPSNAAQYLRTAFPGNIIPASMLNPVSLKALTYVPVPNVPGDPFTAVNNFLSGKERTIDETTLGIRIDHNFGAREKLFGRVAINRYNLNQPDYYGNAATTGDGALGTVTLNASGAVLQSTTTISSTTVLSVSLGYAQWIWNRNQRSWGFNQEDLGLPASYVKQLQYPLFPALSIANMANIGGGNNLTLVSQDTSSLPVSLTRISGRHTIKTGFDVRMLREFLTTGNPAGLFSFTQAMTSGPNPVGFSATAGAGIASYMLGAFSSGNVSLLAGASLKSIYYAGYVQDDFRLNGRLTLSVGLRWETTSPYTERHNQLNRFDPALASPAANPQFPSLQGGLMYASAKDRRMYSWCLNNWEPRFGFAYHPLSNTVVRGGLGLVYSFFPTANADTGFSPNQGFSATTNFLGTLDGVTPYHLLNAPAPEGLVQPTPASQLGASTFLGQNLTVWDNQPRTPRVWQWNFDIQQDVRGVLFDLAYVGNRGAKLNSPLAIDTLSPSYLSLGNGLQQLVTNPFAGIIGVGTLANPTVQRYQLLLPYPQYTGITVQNQTWGHSEYHAMEVKVKKRIRRGITMLAGYTFSKLFGDVSNTVTNNGNGQDAGLNSSTQNPYNLGAEWSVSEMDVTHNLTFNTVVELPFGPGRALLSSAHGLPAKLISGWELSTLLLAHGGFPLVLTAPGVIVGNRPNRTCSGAIAGDRSKGERIRQWFDTSCFSVPAPFTFGNDSRTNDAIRSPSFSQLDIGLAKHQKLFREAATLTFRAEAFNLSNTVHLAPPNLAANNTGFGQISADSGKPRVLQMALKLAF